jgi:hypothetical protein
MDAMTPQVRRVSASGKKQFVEADIEKEEVQDKETLKHDQ